MNSARRALEHGRFIELRLDWLPNPALALPLVPELLKFRPVGRAKSNREITLVQATCRRQANGGRFAGTVAEQMEILQRATAAGCRVVDLEIESAEASGAEAIEALRHQAPLILSYHDFERTNRLDAAARRLRQFPADFYKVVTTATRQSDNCAALGFLRSITAEQPKNEKWIVFCMGTAGIPSRVLALSRGSAFIYASCPPSGGTSEKNSPAIVQAAAPGQIDYEILRNVYRAEKLTAQTTPYGLLGNPVGHSLGAAIHNAAFRSLGLDAVYMPLLSSDLKDFRKAANVYPLAGFSVTIPHKQKILRFLDRVDRIVKMAGAANTVRIRHGRWEAINTDVEGIVVPVRRMFRLTEEEFFGRKFRAVVLGTGGAARAALTALRELRCRDISIAGRNPAKARRLAKEFGGKAISIASLSEEVFALMIHSTPVGMWPHSDQCLLRPEQINANVVFDLVYNPAQTRLLQLARERRCKTISGLEMFLAQAARQFEYWTGVEAPRRLMRKTAKRELARFLAIPGAPGQG